MSLKKFKQLARNLKGELKTDLFSREIFASAACIYHLLPQAVAFPRDDEDLRRIAEFALAEKIPLTARGAGSAVAGQTLGKGLIINFTRYFNRILKIVPEEKKVLVEPGVIYADLNKALEPYGLFFPPDPSSGDYCTIGGMLANNSSGAHSLFYGATQKYLKELELVLADGSKVRLGENLFEILEPKSDLPHKIQKEVPALLKRHQEEIVRAQPRVKNASGYLIWGALSQTRLDYAKLLVGSEGTLGIILRAWLKLEAIPRVKNAGLIFFHDLSKATIATQRLKAFQPLAIEIMDRNFLQLVHQHYPELRALLDDKAEVMLLVEFSGETEKQVQEKLENAFVFVVDQEQLGFKFIIARDPKQASQLWKVRKSASPILYRLGSGLVRFIEDIVIPPEKLPEGIGKIQEFFKELKTFAPILGHAGEGNLHLNPDLNPRNPQDRKKMQILADLVYKAVISLGGSITGEHGDGILRAPYVPLQFPEVYPVFKQLKKIFDPEGILNPGKILAEPGLMPVENIKYWSPEHKIADQNQLELIFRCHGCGLCRTYCPAFQGFQTESALPRSKVSIARALAQNTNQKDILKSPELKNLLNYCYACQRCLKLCPTGVAVPRILEPLRNYQRQEETLSLRTIILERAGVLLNLMEKLPRSAIRISASASAKQVLKSIGLNPQASAWFKPQELAHPRRGNEKLITSDLKIIYFPGCLENTLDSVQVEITLKILNLLETETFLLKDFCCGLPAINEGNLELAKKQAQKLLKKIIPLLKEGYQILTNCPSCLFIFQEQYPLWFEEKAELISNRMINFSQLISLLKPRLRISPEKTNWIYHRACHLIGLGEPDPVLSLLQALEFTPQTVVEQCCGAGGAFEMKIENALASAKISALLKEELKKTDAKTIISGCGLCRRKIKTLGFEVKSPLEMIDEFLIKD